MKQFPSVGESCCDGAMSPLLTLKEAAAELRVSKRWLEYWLVEHPVDAAGVPFYIPMGSRKKFESADLDRIRSFMRDLERVRLGPRATAAAGNARLLGLLAQSGGYEELVKLREKQERQRTRKGPPQRRVRLPRAKRPPEG